MAEQNSPQSIRMHPVPGWASSIRPGEVWITRVLSEAPALEVEISDLITLPDKPFHPEGPVDEETDLNVRLVLRFESVRAFRVVDELDLLDYWQAGYPTSTSLVWQVESGGWLDHERTVHGRFLGLADEAEEYLIVTGDACVSVISSEPPTAINP